jgi:hypothetical protein
MVHLHEEMIRDMGSEVGFDCEEKVNSFPLRR